MESNVRKPQTGHYHLCLLQGAQRTYKPDLRSMRRANGVGAGAKMKGQALVELGITFVFLMYLLSGVAQIGIAFFQYVQLKDAAQEGALYASWCPDEDQIRQRIIGSSFQPVDLNKANISLTGVGNPEGEAVTVTVTYQHKIFMPFMSLFFGDYITIKGEVTDTVLTVDGCE
jgi:Flp pilus assembly protein TadG